MASSNMAYDSQGLRRMKILQIVLLISVLIMGQVYGTASKIKGKVVDQKSGEGVSHAEVTETSGIGTATKPDGSFELSLSPGTYDLRISHIAYFPEKIRVPLKNSQIIDTLITLKPRIIPLKEVNVRAERLNELALMLTPSATVINQRLLNSLPTVGEPDLFRTLQTMPGVAKANELTSRISVRGGSSDQNLIAFDNIELFNPHHLYGLTSSFNVEAIGQALFMPGGFSVQYGDRLGSVIDIRSKEPDSTFSLGLHLGIISPGAVITGHVGKKIGYLAAGRLNYFEHLKKITSYAYMPYHYQDWNAKIVYDPSPNHRFTLSTFGSNDLEHRESNDRSYIYVYLGTSKPPMYDPDSVIFYPYRTDSRYALNWKNLGYAMAWNGSFGSWNGKILLSYSSAADGYDWYREAVATMSPFPPDYAETIAEYNKDYQAINVFSDNRLEKYRGSAHLSHRLSEKLTMNWGGELALLKMNYFWQNMSLDEYWMLYVDHPPSDYRFQWRTWEQACFAEAIWHPTSGLMGSLGLRLNRMDALNRWHANPRVNIRYDIADNLKANLAIGRFSQTIGTARESGLITPVDLYFPSAMLDRFESADHYIFSVDYSYRAFLRLSCALYRKNFRNLLTRYNEQAVFALESGYAQGLELKVDYDLIRLQGYLSYTLSKSMRDLNGYRYPSNYDQRHRAQIVADLHLGRNWFLNSNWEFYTGQPYDPGVIRAVILDAGLNLDTLQPLYFFWHTIETKGMRGVVRHPYYHRLDLGISKRFYFGFWSISPYFRVMNAYMRKNVLYYKHLWYEYPGIPDPNEKPTLTREAETLPLILTLGMNVNFR